MALRKLSDYIQDIYDSASGPDTVAFFDFDKTLIAGYSAKAFLIAQIRSGDMSMNDMRKQLSAIAKFSSGRLDFSGLIAATAEAVRGQAEYILEEMGERVFEKKIAGAIYPEARALLDAHRNMGHTIAIVSSATKYQIEPAARELDIEYILCTDLEVADGVFTGKALSPTCFGVGKLYAGEDFCEDIGASLDDAFFYTDSEDDLPLLEVVGHPRVVNPSKKMASIARKRSYPVCRFEGGERPSLGRIARMGSVYALMPTSMAVTAPLWPLAGDKRTALNAGVSIWTNLAAAVAGLKFEIEGEENLWSHRPAVFIFNHQSAVDTVIVAKLVQRDFTAIAKKEIASFPVIGQAFKYSDVILIDRKNSAKAIEQIKPVISAIRDDKLSVCLSPEGTRSVGRKLGAFKKGAFHIAMQAEVPIVPIVIHNAGDALPKGHHIARPATIKISVLDPIDTSNWSVTSLNKHVKEVRQLFLDALGQVEA